LSRTSLSWLFEVTPPWIFIGAAESEAEKWIPSGYYSREGLNVCVRNMRGKKMRTYEGLMNEFSAALQFFYGFGENWPALNECLCYLDEWLPAEAYVIVIECAEEVFREESDHEIHALLDNLHDVGEWWAKPITDNGRFNRGPIPFHILFNFSAGQEESMERFVKSAAAKGIPVRHNHVAR
jgi:hypothetical protein